MLCEEEHIHLMGQHKMHLINGKYKAVCLMREKQKANE